MSTSFEMVFLQEDFFFIMQNLPVHVPDDDIAEMFAFADKDGDGQLSYEEFEVDDGDGEVDKICSPTIR